MRRPLFGLWVLAISMLAQGASAIPLDVTYSVSGYLVATSGNTSSATFAGAVTLRFPGGGAPAVGGSLDYSGQISVVSGQMTATGAPLEILVGVPETSIFVTTLVWPTAVSGPPFGDSFVALFAPGGFLAEGHVIPGSFVLDVTFRFSGAGGLGVNFANGTISGSEVSRQLVPEPSVAALVGFGLLAGVLTAKRGRR